jgi:MFS family permease
MGRILRIRGMPQAMVASMTVLSSVDILVLYLPVYGAANAIPVETIGLLLSARAGASMLARILMLPLRRLLGRRRLLVASMVVPAIVLASLPFSGGNLAVLVLSMFVIGAGLGLGQPLTLSWVADRAPDGIRGTAIGVRLTANRFGQVALPAIVALAVGAAGISAIFGSLSILLGVSAIQVARADLGDAPRSGARPPAARAEGDG